MASSVCSPHKAYCVGMRHEILHRSWDKPTQPGHIQEAARKHRYMLLYEKCRSEGIHNLLTAHQLEVGPHLLATSFNRE